MSNPVYIRCPKCGAIRFKRIGGKRFKCKKCGHIRKRKGSK